MNLLPLQLRNSPLLARVAPFVCFIAITFCQDKFGDAARYWLYLAKTIVAAWMLWELRAVVEEMRWKLSLDGVIVGITVFALWVGLDDFLVKLGFANSYPKMKLAGAAWNPPAHFGEGTALAWFFIVVRIAGSTLVVPVLEEVFFRSFVYRYIVKVDFQRVPLGQFAWLPFLATSVLFGFEHREWLAGILCGFAYQGLVCWKKRLGDAITAHAVTNLLLGLWVVWKGAWHFW